MSSLRYVFVDIETTGLDHYRHELLEVAAIEVDVRLNELRTFERKIRPEHIHTAHPKALEVNGYTEAEWANAHDVRSVMTELAPWIDGVVLFAHNIAFDWKFLSHNFKQLGLDPKPILNVDTMSVADLLIAEGKYSGSRSLGTLCRHFGIVNQHAHRALGDARACLDFVRIARKLKEQN